MPLPTNNSRPAIPYQPEQILPNYNRYENLGQFPPTAQQLDGDMNRIIDLLNTQSAEINGIVVGALPGANDPLNANFLLTTDGNGNISWTPINQVNLGVASVGTNNIIDAVVTSAKIQPQAIQTQHIENNAVWGTKIYDGAVTTSKIANNAVTTNKISNNSIITSHLQDKAVTGVKVADLTLPYTALQSAGSVSMLASRTDFNNGRIYAMTMTDWYVPVKRPNEQYVSSVALNEVFNNSANNAFNGAKLANNTVTNAQIADGTITTALYANLSITGAKLANNTVTNVQIADGTITTALYANGSITGAKLANNTITNAQILDGSITTALYANGSITGAKIANNTITNAQILDGSITTALYVNGSITGAKVADATIPKTKLQNAGQIAPFAILSVDSNATILKSLNIASVTRTTVGLIAVFRVVFTTAASSANAIVILTPNDTAASPNAVSASNYTQSTTQVDVAVRDVAGTFVYGGFDMIVYDI